MSKRLQERNAASAHNSSSSSSSRREAVHESSNPKKRGKVTICGDLNDDEREVMDSLKASLGTKMFTMSGEDVEKDISRCSTKVSILQKERDSWDSVSNDVKAQCVKVCVRLLLMKGTKHENMNRQHVFDAIKEIDKSYTKHVNQILIDARKVINKRFGYVVRSGSEFDKENGVAGDKQTFFLTNSVDSPVLYSLLVRAEAPAQKAFRGFMLPIFLTLFVSPGRKASLKALLANVRMIDPRFPETVLDESNAKAVLSPVGGLDSDFKTLIARMKNEKYIVSLKEREGSKEAQENDKTEYKFGPRFHSEIGLKKCAQMYFMACGEVPDARALEELDEEERLEEEKEEEEA